MARIQPFWIATASLPLMLHQIGNFRCPLQSPIKLFVVCYDEIIWTFNIAFFWFRSTSGEAWGWVQGTLPAWQLQAGRSTKAEEVPHCWGGLFYHRWTVGLLSEDTFNLTFGCLEFSHVSNAGYKLQAALHWWLSFALCCHLAIPKEEIRCRDSLQVCGFVLI